ncbi:hypothetical protein P154DRAFT_537130 [Amniculicola lignicola CBS 123094]|uniref:Uncharacterized protein n=1 Tax=Amniculicola lignicola CBS 123094 TaxID=1392246 RepID=A0A6A5W8J4_9PLEO|nr:hypothetical protein P154DRAFT_537130 [Amniculicola lignicola CBS 123094]
MKAPSPASTAVRMGCLISPPLAIRCYVFSPESNLNISPLLRLPGELRNKIFECALGGRTFESDKNINIQGITLCDSNDSELAIRENLLSLPLVSRQVYAEAACIPFAFSLFHYHHLWNFNWCMTIFCSHWQRQAVAALRVKFGGTALIARLPIPELRNYAGLKIITIELSPIGKLNSKQSILKDRSISKYIEDKFRSACGPHVKIVIDDTHLLKMKLEG